MSSSIANADKMDAYESYAGAIWAPVVFPLAFALISQFVVYLNACKHWMTGQPMLPSWSGRAAGKASQQVSPPRIEVEVPVMSLMLSETIFGVCCIIQCAVNYSHRSYVGGARACEWQGLYACYYTFASTGLCAVTALVGARAIAPKSPAPSHCGLAVGAGIVVHGVALTIAALPLLGASGARYMFAHDYCQHDIESPLYARIFLCWWTFCTILVAYAAVRVACASAAPARAAITADGQGPSTASAPPPPHGARRLFLGIAIYYVIAWLPSLLITFTYLARGGPVSISPLLGLFGVQAIALHFNQLAVPMLFAWRLREHMNAAYAMRGEPPRAVCCRAQQAV
jgi:hypothetical protein